MTVAERNGDWIIRAFLLVLFTFFLSTSLTACREIKESKQLIRDVAGIETIHIQNGVGNILCKPSNSSEIKVSYIKMINGEDKSLAKEVSNKTSVSFSVVEKTLIINALYEKDKDLWRWKTDNYEGDISLDYIIEIPPEVKNINCQTGVGRIDLNELNACFDIKTDLGDIKANDLVPSSSSSFATDLGEIQVDFSNIENAQELSIENDLGDISLSIPKSSKYKIDAIVNNHQIQLPSDDTAEALLTIRAGLGKLRINKS